MMRDKMTKRFEKLRRHIELEYIRKGVPTKRAEGIAYATAAKVYREKEAIMKHPILAHIVKPKRVY